MEAIGELGELETSRTRPAGEVHNGYTPIEEGDVILAKITPCFENGKAAVARGLLGGVGFGTTELHVLRARHVGNRFLYYVTPAKISDIEGAENIILSGIDRIREYRQALITAAVTGQLEVAENLAAEAEAVA